MTDVHTIRLADDATYKGRSRHLANSPCPNPAGLPVFPTSRLQLWPVSPFLSLNNAADFADVLFLLCFAVGVGRGRGRGRVLLVFDCSLRKFVSPNQGKENSRKSSATHSYQCSVRSIFVWPNYGMAASVRDL